MKIKIYLVEPMDIVLGFEYKKPPNFLLESEHVPAFKDVITIDKNRMMVVSRNWVVLKKDFAEAHLLAKKI